MRILGSPPGGQRRRPISEQAGCWLGFFVSVGLTCAFFLALLTLKVHLRAQQQLEFEKKENVA